MLWGLADTGVVVERSGEAQTQVQAQQGDTGAGHDGEPSPSAEPVPSEQDVVPQRLVVHVDGAVATPGVVELWGDDLRVCDAVDAAGGLCEDADTALVNLAEPLADGRKVHVPHQGEQAIQDVPVSLSPAEVATAGGLVNINTAGVEELQTLRGVGEVTARAIVEDREQNGPFETPEDLMRVSGIGEKKFAKVKEAICV